MHHYKTMLARLAAYAVIWLGGMALICSDWNRRAFGMCLVVTALTLTTITVIREQLASEKKLFCLGYSAGRYDAMHPTEEEEEEEEEEEPRR